MYRPRRGEAGGGTRDWARESALTLEQVLPEASRHAREQEGSRFLQTVLEGQDEVPRQQVFDAILPSVVELATDAFGNFVVQKLLERGSGEQREALAARMQQEFVHLANDKFGCRVVQKAFEVLSVELQTKISEELRPKLLGCIDNMNGNHVIQRCIEQMPPERLGFVLDVVLSRVESTASHSYGCRVVQRLLERCSKAQVAPLLDHIVSIAKSLAQDAHGNYVVQCALEHGRREDQEGIISALLPDLVRYATSRCSSNVVEKCLKVAWSRDHPELEEARRTLFGAVLGQPQEPAGPLRKLIHDRFGNYTVQCLIRLAHGEDRDVLRQTLLDMEPELRGSNAGRHILTTLRKEAGTTSDAA